MRDRAKDRFCLLNSTHDAREPFDNGSLPIDEGGRNGLIALKIVRHTGGCGNLSEAFVDFSLHRLKGFVRESPPVDFDFTNFRNDINRRSSLYGRYG